VCGRYTLAGPNPGELHGRFALGESLQVRRRFNVCPGDDVVAVTTDREGAPRGELLRWGLVPHWAKDPGVGYKTINARAETLAERPAYRDALRTHRCLIVADGFYEWAPAGPGRPRKQPFWITRADGAPFAFAGLWAVWNGPGGEVVRSCTIVTTNANPVLAPIHDRMPVILPGPDAEQAWIDHATPQAEALGLLRALPDEAVAMREVGFAVNDAGHDEPDCLDPPGPPAEMSLF
jgi:putative SOS response-associated peptidase YedK